MWSGAGHAKAYIRQGSSDLEMAMLALNTVIAFFGLAFLMALSPGPNLLYLLSRSICQGTAAGFASLAGIATGMLVYMLLTAGGLATLFSAVPLAYDLVRICGVTYLVWLAIKAIWQRSGSVRNLSLPPRRLTALWRSGVVTCIFNPKIVLMYGALLPQFLSPGQQKVLTATLELGGIQIAAACTAHSLVILGASRLSGYMKGSARFKRVQKYLLSASLLGVAARIAFDRRGVS